MSNDSNNVHFSGERLICNPYLIIIVPRFARADNDKIRAANESSALKMNIIVILYTLKKIIDNLAKANVKIIKLTIKEDLQSETCLFSVLLSQNHIS